MLVSGVQDIGQLIRQERKNQGLTQAQLAGLCNLSVRFVIAAEQGKETAQIGKVMLIIRMLGLRMDIGK